MNRTFIVPKNAPFYKGSGQGVAAVSTGVTIDGIYIDSLADELPARAELRKRHGAAAKIAGGMFSSYEFTVFDPSELDRAD